MCRHWTRWSAEISMKVQSRRMVRFMFRAIGDDEVDDRYTPVVDRDIRHVIAAR
jgi:hypothetical protein